MHFLSSVCINYAYKQGIFCSQRGRGDFDEKSPWLNTYESGPDELKLTCIYLFSPCYVSFYC